MKCEYSEMFKVLAVDTRVKIIDLLKSKGPLGAKSMAEQLGITVAAVSQHLKILKQAGLVRNERKGYWIPYSIDREALKACGQMLNQVCTCGCEETCKQTGRELKTSDLQVLKDYQEELLSELMAVRKRIEEIELQESAE